MKTSICFRYLVLGLMLLFPIAAWPNNMANADLDGNGISDVVINFGPDYGIWVYMNDVYWFKLHTLPSFEIKAGDIDGNGQSDVVIDFGPQYGTWIYVNDHEWVQWHPLSPIRMDARDLDGNGQAELLMDFGSLGLWIFVNSADWFKINIPGLSSTDITDIKSGDIDGNGISDLVITAGPKVGIWVAMSLSPPWTQLHSLPAHRMIFADMDDNGQSDIVIDFGPPHGIWVHMNNSQWVKLHSLPSYTMFAADMDNNGKGDIGIDFGPAYGIWVYMNNSNWIKLHNLSSHEIMVADMGGTGMSDIVIDFGSEYGIWMVMQNFQWVKLHHLESGNANTSAENKKKLLASVYNSLITNNSYNQTGGSITQSNSLANRCLIGGDIYACIEMNSLQASQNGKPYVDPIVKSGDPNIDNYYYKFADMCYGNVRDASATTGHCY